MPTVVIGDVPARSELSLREAAGAAKWASAQGNNRDNGSYVPQPLDFRNSITAPANVVNMAVTRAEPHGGASCPSPRRQRVTKLSSTATSQFVREHARGAAATQHHRTAQGGQRRAACVTTLQLWPIDTFCVGHRRQGVSLCNSAFRA
jgi:hypothetical protein